MNNNNKVLRDLHLCDLNTGKKQGPMTGNIFIDKPWTPRFQKHEYSNIELCETLYKNYIKASEEHLDELAIYEVKTNQILTHRELRNKIDTAAAGFIDIGLNENSKVGSLMNNSIDDTVNFLACSKIGATCKLIDFTKTPEAMKHSVDETDLNTLIMDEDFLPLLPLINQKQLPVIVANTNKEFKEVNFTTFNSIYEKGKNKEIIPADYVDNKPTVMINSSGTTGTPKPIVHTDFSVNAAVQKMLYTDYHLGNGNVIMKMIPSQIGLGLITTMYTGLLSGTTVVLVAGVSPEELAFNMISFVKNFESFKKEYNLKEDALLSIFTAPAFVRALILSDAITDLSCIGTILAAGSKIAKKELDELTEIARKKGYKYPICNGYGQNEMAGAATLNTNAYNKNGSGGYPTIGTSIRIVKVLNVHPLIVDTKTTLGVNEEGLILEDSDSRFLEYEKMSEKTKESFITLEDGSTWFITNDLGHIDEEGFVQITGRLTRVATRNDFKIPLDDLEAKIKSIPTIEDCATIVTEFGGSLEPIAVFAVPINENIDIEAEIKNSNVLSFSEVPEYFITIDKLPYLGAGKINEQCLKKRFKQLEEENQLKLAHKKEM